MGGDPVNLADPSGEYACSVAGGVNGIFVTCRSTLGWMSLVRNEFFPISLSPLMPRDMQEAVLQTIAKSITTGIGRSLDRAALGGNDPCDIDVEIDKYISNMPIYGSWALPKPLSGHGAAFLQAGETHGVDPRVLVGIAFMESHWGYDTRNSGAFNAFGILKSNGLESFPSWAAASKRLRTLFAN